MGARAARGLDSVPPSTSGVGRRLVPGVENRPVREVAAQYGVCQSWLVELLTRFKAVSEDAFEPAPGAPEVSRPRPLP